ncbi:MAG TPA: hypothetical protein VNO22_09420 [Planctomycetota bacterium]|jgi:hypothetical protein|nr:hypothetical protein [Planctomycetota bacterium]
MRIGWAILGLAGAAAAQDLSWVERRVEESQPTPEERKFDRIGWVTRIGTALELARRHQRPVFLFTHDGRMARGRC